MVIEGLDRSDRGAGMPVADALAQALSATGIPVAAVLPRPSPVLTADWLQAELERWKSRVAVTATVSGWNLRPWSDLAYVEMTGLALAPDGTILWAERVNASAPWSPPGSQTQLGPGPLFHDRRQESAIGGTPGELSIQAQGRRDPALEMVMTVPTQSTRRSQDGERALFVAARMAAKEFAVDLARNLVALR